MDAPGAPPTPPPPAAPASFDVVIAGGGPAGAATALALRRAGVPRVLIAEASRFDGPRIGESVPPDLRRLLAALGLDEAFAAEGHAPCHGSCSSWGGPALGYNDFLFDPAGPGFHLDRGRFDAWLARAAAAAGAELWTDRRLAIEPPRRAAPDAAHRVRLTGPGGDDRWVTARVVVDATGRAARVARQLGATRVVHDRLTVVYGWFAPGAASRASSLTMLEAIDDGWWYAARLPDGQLVVAVASDPSLVRDRGLHRPEIWRARLAATRHVGALIAPDAGPSRPLIACEAPSARLDRVAGPGWLAVGDAASSFDPLSSQGIHKALTDGLAAAAAISGWLLRGDAAAIDRYAAAVTGRFDAYLGDLARLYAREQRWPDAPFWAQRQAR